MMTSSDVELHQIEFNMFKNHISWTTRGKFTIFPPLYRSLIVKKKFTKRWPQLDLYFLYKPEVKVYYLKKSYLNNRKR